MWIACKMHRQMENQSTESRKPEEWWWFIDSVKDKHIAHAVQWNVLSSRIAKSLKNWKWSRTHDSFAKFTQQKPFQDNDSNRKHIQLIRRFIPFGFVSLLCAVHGEHYKVLNTVRQMQHTRHDVTHCLVISKWYKITLHLQAISIVPGFDFVCLHLNYTFVTEQIVK